MNKFKKIIIFSLIATLPISIYFILWVNNSLSLHSKFGYLSVGIKNELYIAGFTEYLELKNIVLNGFGFTKKADVNIYTDKKNLDELKSNLPVSSWSHKKANLYINNEMFKGKLKLRGDNYYHWLFPQASWRFKFSKKDLASHSHKLNLIIPKGNELINNHLSYKLAKKLKLLAPNSKLVTLSINNKPNGLKLMVAQIDESFLRKNRRMPNDIYKGDNQGSKRISGVALFNSPSIWDKLAYNNHYPKNSKKPLEQLLILKDNSILDYTSLASFSSFIDLINTYHIENTHNWVLYYDNYLEKMFPIIWDPVGWWIDWSKRENITIITSKLMEILHKDYQFLYKKYDVIYHFFKNKKEFLKVLDEEIESTRLKMLDIDYTFRMNNRLFMNSSKSITELGVFRTRVIDRLNKVENYYVGEANKENYSFAIDKNKIRLSISANKMIEKIMIKSKNLDKLEDIYISYITHGKKVIIPLKNNSIIDSNILTIKINLLANAKISSTLTFEEATYDIELKGLETNKVEDISLEFLNLEHQVVSIKKVAHIKPREFKNVYNIVQESQNKTPEVWSTVKGFTGFNIIKNNIIIKPGTKIIFDQNATLKVLGKVTAIGTKENPIIFEAKDKSKPWNAFALKDAKANGSIFKHCIFKDGSGDKGGLYEYTAMFSVHNVKNLLVEDCVFYDSHRTDDMVHVIYSDATFKNTKFVRSLSDALDVDISNVVIDNCEFIDSGNDAIDLMTTNALVTNTKFTNSKDKGISIGEGSNMLAINNYIKGNEIGMQSKDTSIAYIYNSSFVENKIAIDAYHKNWRYSEGGTIFIDQSIFEKNVKNATVGKKSKVVINNSNIDTPDNIDVKSILKKKIVISDNDFIKYEFNETLFDNRESLIQKQIKGYHE